MHHSISTQMLKEVSNKSYNSNKLRNRFIGSIITIATFLLVLATTLGYNAVTDMKNRSLYQGIFSDINDEVIKNLDKNEDVAKYGEFQDVGVAKNGEFTLSILYSDNETMMLSNVRVTLGKIPEKEDEIAIEKEYFERINEKVKIGDKIQIQYRNDASREMQTKIFKLAGIIEAGNGNKERTAFNGIVSKQFIDSDQALSKKGISLAIQVADASMYSNSDLKNKVIEIGIAAGVKASDININDMNIDSNNLSTDTISVFVFIAAIVMLSCAVVIYNIFNVAILRSIRQYGQMHAIGMVRKQIRKLVVREGNMLSIRYIPLGMVLGCIASFIMKPSMWIMGADIILAIASGFITYVTVILSVRKPAKIAASVSPMEAVKYYEYRNIGKTVKKKNNKITTFSLGLMNLFRNRKKTVLTLLSIVFSGVLLICSASILESINVTQKAKQNFVYGGEFLLKLNYELLSEGEGYKKLQVDNPLNDKLKEELLIIDGVDAIGVIKIIECKLDNVDSDYSDNDIQNCTEEELKKISRYLVKGKLTEEALKEDDALIVNIGSVNFKDMGITYEIGDTVSMHIDYGQESILKEFKIAALIDNSNDGSIFYAPDHVIDHVSDDNFNYAYEIICKGGYSATTDSKIRSLIGSEERLQMETLHDAIALAKKDFGALKLGLSTLVAFISIFSLVNLSNTIITNIISRKKEFGLFQAVGMDNKQLRSMIGTENMCLTLGGFGISVVLGSISGFWICKSISKMSGLNYIQYQFPFIPIMIFFITVMVIMCIIVKYTDHTLRSQSVIERIRDVE